MRQKIFLRTVDVHATSRAFDQGERIGYLQVGIPLSVRIEPSKQAAERRKGIVEAG